MNVHENARLTLHGRGLLVKRVLEEGWTMAAASKAAGCSAPTGYQWAARFRSGGERMLADRSSAPARCPHRLPAATVEAIERLRRERLSGPAIARQLCLPGSTVGAVLARLGLGRLLALGSRRPTATSGSSGRAN